MSLPSPLHSQSWAIQAQLSFGILVPCFQPLPSHLDILDILGWIIVCWKGEGCLAASLTSADGTLVALTWFWHLNTSLGIAFCPWLITTAFSGLNTINIKLVSDPPPLPPQLKDGLTRCHDILAWLNDQRQVGQRLEPGSPNSESQKGVCAERRCAKRLCSSFHQLRKPPTLLSTSTQWPDSMWKVNLYALPAQTNAMCLALQEYSAEFSGGIACLTWPLAG